MTSLKIFDVEGNDAGTVDVPDETFGIEPNIPLMHQVVKAQLAAARAGTHKTKTRGEVRGGGSKPWRQKGTGRARAGSNRSPIWVGGGTTHGPVPRSYVQRTPKKMVRKSLACALSSKVVSDSVVVVKQWEIQEPSTKTALAALEALSLRGNEREPNLLLVLAHGDELVWKSMRNLRRVHIIKPTELNTFDVLNADKIVFSTESLGQALGDQSEAGE